MPVLHWDVRIHADQPLCALLPESGSRHAPCAMRCRVLLVQGARPGRVAMLPPDKMTCCACTRSCCVSTALSI